MSNKFNGTDVIEQFKININNFENSMNMKLTNEGRVNSMILNFLSMTLHRDNNYYLEHEYTINELLEEINSYVSNEIKIDLNDPTTNKLFNKKLEYYKTSIENFVTNDEITQNFVAEFYNIEVDSNFIIIFGRNLKLLMNSTDSIANNLDD